MINIKGIISIIPIMIYYLVESFIISLPVSLVWESFLQPVFEFDFHLKYMNWVWIIWICKCILFDVYKISVFNNKNNEEDDNV